MPTPEARMPEFVPIEVDIIPDPKFVPIEVGSVAPDALPNPKPAKSAIQKEN